MRLKTRLSRTCFNSLQTGKCIQSVFGGSNQRNNQVSIPFKRESGSKDKFDSSQGTRFSSFNSLQTGKWIQRESKKYISSWWYSVSIPFKRESVSKEKIWFYVFHLETYVSIPFKRESGSKVECLYQGSKVIKGFNSLQTGKGIQSEPPRIETKNLHEFQFPSNGKVYPKFPSRARKGC